MLKNPIDLASHFKTKKPLYIISMKWFSNWKKYVYFPSSDSHPGNIDQSDILESESDLFLDPNNESNFGNEVLKKGLEENKDYMIAEEKVWHYLSRFYQGREIRRHVINVNDKDYFLVELWLKKVIFALIFGLFFKLPTKDQVRHLAEHSWFKHRIACSQLYLSESKRHSENPQRKNPKSYELLSPRRTLKGQGSESLEEF